MPDFDDAALDALAAAIREEPRPTSDDRTPVTSCQNCGAPMFADETAMEMHVIDVFAEGPVFVKRWAHETCPD